MSEWKVKRFWKKASVEPVDNGYAVKLDGRGVKTPAKSDLILPTRALAQAISEEWEAQEGEINPLNMPMTRSANAAVDKVATQHDEVVAMLTEYGDSDLLCYRADSPLGLVERQAVKWDPLLEWAHSELGIGLTPVIGVMHRSQDPKAMEKVAERVAALDNFKLTAFHDLVSLSGSMIIAFAAIHEAWPITTLWELSRLDESWQEEQWGKDDEATQAAELKKQSFLHAKAFYDLCKPA